METAPKGDVSRVVLPSSLEIMRSGFSSAFMVLFSDNCPYQAEGLIEERGSTEVAVAESNLIRVLVVRRGWSLDAHEVAGERQGGADASDARFEARELPMCPCASPLPRTRS